LNEAGEMLMVFPPTSKEIGVLKSQGTKIEDKNATTNLWCPRDTNDWLKKVCDAGRVTNIIVLPVSKIAAVFPTMVCPFTEILSKGASQ